MNFLNKIGSTSISTRLIAASLRNLSISSQPTTTNTIFLARLDQDELRVPLIARQNTNLVKDVGIRNPLWRRKEINELPLTNKVIENPAQIKKIIEEITDKIIDLPSNVHNQDDDTGKQAKNGMIVIRKRKMKKHKLRKLRKKMKYDWAKRRQRREWKKEKKFQNMLSAQIRIAENFSAERYVAKKLRAATITPTPRFWKGRRLPKFIIRQLQDKEAQWAEKKKLEQWEAWGQQ